MYIFLKYKHLYIIYSRNWAALLSDESLAPIIWSARLTDTGECKIKARSSRFLLHLCSIPTTELFTCGGFADGGERSKHTLLYVSWRKLEMQSGLDCALNLLVHQAGEGLCQSRGDNLQLPGTNSLYRKQNSRPFDGSFVKLFKIIKACVTEILNWYFKNICIIAYDRSVCVYTYTCPF